MFRSPYAQMRIVANPVYDIDFIDWWKRWNNTLEAKSHFLGYVRMGLVLRNQAASTPISAIQSEEKKTTEPVVRRGRRRMVVLKNYSVRFRVGAKGFDDILTAWVETPRRLKSRVFISLWRHGRSINQDPVLMLVPGGRPLENAQPAVINETIVATTVRSEDDMNDHLEKDMDVVMEIWRRQNVNKP